MLSNLAIQSFQTRDEREIADYAELMDLIFNSWRDIPVNETHVTKLRQILLRRSEKDSPHPWTVQDPCTDPKISNTKIQSPWVES